MSSADAAQVRSAQTSVPAPREHSAPVRDAKAGLAAAERATDAVYEVVAALDQRALRGPSLLPGWTRAHVVTHLARNADALVNLLTWAKTGVEHLMYPSRADRDADIEEGAGRLPQLLRADLDAACERFATAGGELPDSAWDHLLAHPGTGAPMPACRVPWLRVRELWVHLVDLDRGVGFGDLPEDVLDHLLADAAGQYANRSDVPPLRVEAVFPDGRQRSWALTAAGADPVAVSGDAADVLGWLTGRQSGARLTGTAPTLPRWL
ncbi:maleylpyruvate isomerase family mycothiol-dependent enzyme [Saccharothrix sp. Mg75]|uniref:maleylpyruvate isomerase family mycothiol-dependent enzyme n=1 Tax=Saccharothrix sp. Mg75 TaxID=3445357 RepID=UPI003EEFCAC4